MSSRGAQRVGSSRKLCAAVSGRIRVEDLRLQRPRDVQAFLSASWSHVFNLVSRRPPNWAGYALCCWGISLILRACEHEAVF